MQACRSFKVCLPRHFGLLQRTVYRSLSVTARETLIRSLQLFYDRFGSRDTMHNADPAPSNATLPRPTYPLVVHFSSCQQEPVDRRLGDLMAQRIERKEFYFGIEVSARTLGTPTVLDYNSFGFMLPMFTSLVWLGHEYWKTDVVRDVDAVRLALNLHPKTVVLPHFSCYKVDQKRIDAFLALNFTNMLIVRGDKVEPDQQFQYAVHMVKYIKKQKGDSVSIGVAGYPEGHPESKSKEEDFMVLKKKVEAGAEFIITQITFRTETLLQFIRDCRSNGIMVPILPGIYVPESLAQMRRVIEIAKIRISKEEFQKYEKFKGQPEEFQEFAACQALDMITKAYDLNMDIFGVQFYTMNKMNNVLKVLQVLSLVQKIKQESEMKTK